MVDNKNIEKWILITDDEAFVYPTLDCIKIMIKFLGIKRGHIYHNNGYITYKFKDIYEYI